MAGGKRRKRLSAEEGRQALIAAGRAMAYERPSGAPLEHVRLTDVAARAGVSVGALYHYWDTQEDYRDDLLDDLFAPQRFEPSPTVADMTEAVDRGLAAPVEIEEVVRLGAEVEFRALAQRRDLQVLMAMWAADDKDVNPRIAAQFRAVGGRWAELYEAVFDQYGIEIRPPFTYPLMAALFSAVGDGLAVRASVDPQSVPHDLEQVTEAGEARAWGLLGCAVLALLPALSRPQGSDEDLFGLIERLRSSGEQFVSRDAR